MIPLRDVNFCVGENSSGKSSFLALVHMLSSPKFWFDQIIEGGESGFGHFDDIVSISAKKRDYFRVGYAEKVSLRRSRKNEDTDERVRAFLFSYRKKDGMPKLHKFTHNYGKKCVTLVFSDKTVRYKVEDIDEICELEDFGFAGFEEWVQKHERNSHAGYTLITDDFVTSEHVPPMFILTYVIQGLMKGKDRDISRAFLAGPGPLFGEVAWIAPIRTKPRRTYDEVKLDFSPEGEHTPYTVKKILDNTEDSQRFIKFVEKFGSESGLFKEVKVHRFGNSVTSPFELDIVLESAPLNISSVGYGVSQALPVMVELFVRQNGAWFAIQQPEVHLHPRAQAAFGEMIFELASNEKKRFIVETHSDFTIDRYRLSQRESKIELDAQVLFFERVDGKNIPTAIPIDRDGELSDQQPKKYREFFLKEELRILGAL